MSLNAPNQAYIFAQQVLGPIMRYYLYLLDQHIQYLDDGNTKFVYVTRAGVRIKKLMDIYRATMGIQRAVDEDYLWVSRILAVKACLHNSNPHALTVIHKEFPVHTVSDVLRALLVHEKDLPAYNPDVEPFSLPANQFEGVLKHPHPIVQRLHSHIHSIAELFEAQVRGLMGEKQRIVMIDSGWQGTSQTLLETTYPAYEWVGLYFATTYGEGQTLPTPQQSHGLVFESNTYKTEQAITAIVHNRHVIESLLEPGVRSVELLSYRDDGRVYAPQAEALLQYVAQLADDAHYMGVCEYLQQHAVPVDGEAIYRDFESASKILEQKILFPCPDDIDCIVTKQRSADFGRTFFVPVVYEPVQRHEWDSAELRVQQAIWQQGQIAVEYPHYEVTQRQLDWLRNADPATYFHDPNEQAEDQSYDVKITEDSNPLVLVVMRTKNRPLLLRRGIQSVVNQIYRNYELVIVNDGGYLEPVLDLVQQSSIDPARVHIISNKKSVGMEAASNLGVRLRPSDYVVIHDDDDSWEPQFLSTMVGFLESPAGKKYGGAVSYHTEIMETIQNDGQVVELSANLKVFQEYLYLNDIILHNVFPPISFVYRRELYDRINGYDESFPVLGDWDFNLRFLFEANIAVVTEFLSRYHKRASQKGSIEYSNSITGASKKHYEYDMIIHNRVIRKAVLNNDASLGVIYSVSRLFRDKPVIGVDQGELAKYQRLADERWAIIQILLQRMGRKAGMK